MLIEDIYEVDSGKLHSVKWDEEANDSFNTMLVNCRDPEYLDRYLFDNEEYLLSGYYNYSNVDRAIEDIQDEVEMIAEEILEACESGFNQRGGSLRSLFVPLNRDEAHRTYYKGKFKAKVIKPILRVYGYLPNPQDDHCVIVTGYGIKLTARMEQHPDLNKELSKMDQVQDYINDIGFFC